MVLRDRPNSLGQKMEKDPTGPGNLQDRWGPHLLTPSAPLLLQIASFLFPAAAASPSPLIVLLSAPLFWAQTHFPPHPSGSFLSSYRQLGGSCTSLLSSVWGRNSSILGSPVENENKSKRNSEEA